MVSPVGSAPVETLYYWGKGSGPPGSVVGYGHLGVDVHVWILCVCVAQGVCL